jgi:hypothetical protein
MNEQGIMALPQGMQAPTAQPMMGGLPPEVLMAFEQARGTQTPEQVSSDTLGAMQEADPSLVAELRQALQGMNLPFEVIDVLGQLVDAVLANPQDYQEMRADLMSDPEVADMLGDLLPETFDPALFAGLNIALDQLVMDVNSPQGFANGGIASIKPIAAQLAKMGRKEDTMLAHITPSEARMLRMRGGAGTINPATGMPEFFIKKAFKKVTGAVKKVVKGVGKVVKGVVKGIGKVVSKIASNPIGRMLLTAAAIYFGGPILGSYLGSMTAPVIAGMTNTAIGLANGEKFGDALKQGVVAGATVWAGQQVMGAFTGTPSATPAPIENAAVYDPATGLTSTGNLSGSSLMPPDLGSVAGIQAPGTTAATAAPPPAAGAGVDYSITGGAAMPDYIGTATQAAPDPYFAGISAPSQSAYAVSPTPTAATTGVAAAPKPSAFEQLVNTGTNLYNQDYAKAASSFGDALFGTPLRTGATLLAGTTLAGGFTPKEPEPPGLVPSETGYDLLRAQPDVYGTAPGGAQTVYAQYAPLGMSMDPYAVRPPQIQFNPPQYPTFAANGGEIRRYADGGIASLLSQSDSSQYQPISVFYDAKNNSYVMQNPAYKDSTNDGVFGASKLARLLLSKVRPDVVPQRYIPFDPGLFTSGMSPQQYLESQKQAQQAAAAKPFFTPGGAVTVPIQENLAGMAGNAVPMFAKGGMPQNFPRKNGQISGPGTEKSDDIPAMLSDGEFVMTARAVRGAGGGSRREGAKRMYALMHSLERKA